MTQTLINLVNIVYVALLSKFQMFVILFSRQLTICFW